MKTETQSGALLGDTPVRDYSSQLHLFNACAHAEISEAIDWAGVAPGMRVIDAGCGTGETLPLLRQKVGGEGIVVGVDLAAAHAFSAREIAPADVLVVQGDLQRLPHKPRAFDLLWCVNTINHFKDALSGINALAGLVRPAGRIAIGQSSFLPDMLFAWDQRLERAVTEAVRAYYRDRYGVAEEQYTANRALVGLLKSAGLRNVKAHTLLIERVAPLREQDEAYLLGSIFRSMRGDRLRPYLRDADFATLTQICDPASPSFALRRSDLHFLQTLTVVVGDI